MSTLALALLASGCFYLDGINERPSAEIVRLASSNLVRGGWLDLAAVVDDPDGDPVTYRWTARACGAAAASCDPTPFAEGTQQTFSLAIPGARAGGAPLAAVRASLEVVDRFGAAASPTQVLVVDIGNRAPTIALQVAGLDGDAYPAGLPVWFTAITSDGDDGPDAVTLAWELDIPREPPTPSWTFEPSATPPSTDPAARQERRRLLATTPGTWTVRVTATDPLGAAATASLGITIDPDRPPCLTAASPWPEPGAVLLLEQPRRLEVVSVDDDLAPYPPPTDGYRTSATFQWSLASTQTGGALVTLPDATASALELDPQSLAPGEIVAVRVEIDDGVGRPSPCGPDLDTCSLTADACVQRLTWHLEVR
ncbi:MAG: hypothetical protein R2939_19320 [Kofleriaceae bacterium]